jgi:hypothetical protein
MGLEPFGSYLSRASSLIVLLYCRPLLSVHLTASRSRYSSSRKTQNALWMICDGTLTPIG